MAELSSRPAGRSWTGRGWRIAVLIAAVVSVAGCVGMPDSGGVGQVTATQSASAQNDDYVGTLPIGPHPGEAPEDIVSGFLSASASISPAGTSTAQEYLVGSAGKSWNPGWTVKELTGGCCQLSQAIQATQPASAQAAKQTEVDLTGTVQAAYDETGQYVTVQSHAPALYQFKLVQVNGQWRIANPPPYRIVGSTQFPDVYKLLDLYFFGTQSTGESQGGTLVPDSVFVPDNTAPAALAGNLVRALIQGPATSWLKGAVTTAFPSGTTVLGVSLDGATAVVNLGKGAARASHAQLTRISAQLAWTLGGVSLGGSANGPAIQSVELEVNGKAVVPSPAACGGGSASPAVQKQASYNCYNPYLSASAGFYFVDDNQPWLRCALESEVQQGMIGPVQAVFGREAGPAAPSAAQCATPQYESHGSSAALPTQPVVKVKAQSPVMVAMSADGKYLAEVNTSDNTVSIRATAGGATNTQNLGPDITAISWDRNDYLWVAEDGAVKVMTATGSPGQVQISGSPDVTSLSVAPDGVRIALVEAVGATHELYLGAITNPSRDSTSTKPLPSVAVSSIGPLLRLASALTNLDEVAWYNADTMVALTQAGTSNSDLWQVPVDGESAAELTQTPSDMTSLTADGDDGAIAVGLTGNHMDISAGLLGPWQPLGTGGQNPAFPG